MTIAEVVALAKTMTDPDTFEIDPFDAAVLADALLEMSDEELSLRVRAATTLYTNRGSNRHNRFQPNRLIDSGKRECLETQYSSVWWVEGGHYYNLACTHRSI